MTGGNGVEIRDKSIRLVFFVEGERLSRTLMIGGKPVRPSAANIRYANRVAIEIRERIRAGTFVLSEYFPASGAGPGAAMLADQLDTWLGAQRIEHSTRAAYTSACKFWKKALEGKTLRGLKLSDVMTVIASRPDLNGKTINNYVSVLREAVELAVRDGDLESNPVAGVPRAKWQRDPPDPFTVDEANRIIADMVARYPAPVGNMTEWRFFTGVRTSEMAGLRWPSVDLASAHVQISEAIVRGVEKSKTKTAVSRQVLLNSRALAALQRQREHTFIAGDHVWLDPRYGSPWLEERAYRRSFWAPTLKRLGIRYRPPNHMRHTYASMLLMAGRKPAWVAKQLGHSVEMLLRTYARWIEGQEDDRELASFEDWLGVPAKKAKRK